MATIKVDQLSKAIMANLAEYSADVVKAMNTAGNKVTNQAVEELQQASAQTFSQKSKRKRTGRYAEGWTVKRVPFHLSPTQYIIHNKDRYQLTHLLEKGHANRDGTRTPGTPHIKPVEEKLIKDYIAGVEQSIAKMEKKKAKAAKKR